MNLHDVKRLKVLGKEYEVVWYGEHPVPAEDLLLHGKCDWGVGKIYIRECLDADRAFDTMIHEVIHAIKAEMDIVLEERDIVGLASGLQCFFKDNFYLELRERVKNEPVERV